VLLADDHGLVRQGLRLILDAQPDLKVVREAGDGEEAFNLALSDDVDLAVLDVAMPRLTGLQVAERLKRYRPEVRVLLLSMYDNEQYFFEALNAGASGYVLKNSATQDLVAACRAAMRGEPFIYPRALAALVRDRTDPLTPRESEVVKLIAEGFSAKEIAEQLVISEKTVERHRSNILEKLELRDRVALTRYAIRRGLVEP
jgi:DNA-binding NarL/FixJ family response regulator